MEDPKLAALFAAVGAGILSWTVVALTLRVLGQRYAMPTMVGSAAIVFAVTVGLIGSYVSFWHFSAFYAGAIASMIFLYGAALKSLSLEMLLEMARRSDGVASLPDLARQVTELAFADRANLLVQMGAAQRSGTNYRPTEHGVEVARRVSRVRTLLRIDTLGLYGNR